MFEFSLYRQITSFLLLLIIAPIISFILWGLPFFSYEWIIFYYLILILSILLIGFAFYENEKVNSKLISQRVLFLILLNKILSLILKGVSVFLVNTNKELPGELLFNLSEIISSFIPIIFILYITLFKKASLKLIISIPAVFIFTSSIGLIAIRELTLKYSSYNFSIFITRYPTFINAILVNLSYFLVGIYIIYSISKTTNFGALYYKPLLVGQYIGIIIGFVIYFFLAPSLIILQFLLVEINLFLLISIQEVLFLLGMWLIIIPNFHHPNFSFNLIPQSIEKLVVMNSVGLPLLTHDFGYNPRVLYSDILVTSSLTAIVSYLTHSEILSSRVSSINFEDRILLFRIKNNFTFIAIVKQKTKIIESAMKVFMEQFLPLMNPKFSTSGYINLDFLEDKYISILIQDCFGDREHHNIDLDATRDKSKETVPVGKIITGFVLAFIAQRLIIFQGTTVLLPNELEILPIVLIIIYSCLIYLSGIFAVFENIKSHNFILLFNISLFLLLTLLDPGVIYMILSWIFGFSTFWYLLRIWKEEIIKLGSISRFRTVIFSFILDISFRIVSFGTNLTIYRNLDILYYEILMILILLVISFKLKINVETNKENQRFYLLEFSVLPIMIFYSIYFHLNIGTIFRYFKVFTDLNYLILTISWVVFLILVTSPIIVRYLFNNPILTWIFMITVLLINIFLMEKNSYLIIPIFFISPISIAFIISSSPHKLFNYYKINQSLFLLFLTFLLPSLMFFVSTVSYYGGSNFFLLIPIFLMLLIYLPKNTISAIKIDSQQILSISLVVLLLFSFAIPSILRDHEYNISSDNQLTGIMTYNIQYGVNGEFAYNPSEVAKFIVESGVSIVGLHEITRASVINGNGDLLFQISRILEDNGFFYSLIMESPPEIFTNAIFSKYPIIKSESIHFSSNVIYVKGFITATIDINGQQVDLINTHLTHVYSEDANNTRMEQVKQIIDYVDKDKKIILIGDFNVEPQDREIKLLTRYFRDNWISSDPGYTWPVEDPNQRIDYIFSLNLNATSEIIGDYQYSDHLPVIAWFNI